MVGVGRVELRKAPKYPRKSMNLSWLAVNAVIGQRNGQRPDAQFRLMRGLADFGSCVDQTCVVMRSMLSMMHAIRESLFRT